MRAVSCRVRSEEPGLPDSACNVLGKTDKGKKNLRSGYPEADSAAPLSLLTLERRGDSDLIRLLSTGEMIES